MGAAWLLRRLVASVAIIFAVVTFIFILIHLAPGKPCSENLEPRVCDLLTRQFGLDQPIAVQYWRYLVELIFGEKLRLFPVGGASDPIFCPVVTSLYCVADRLWHLVLPATTLGVVGAAGTARFQRAAMLEVASQDYVRTARAKGVPEREIVLRHQLRNALLSFI